MANNNITSRGADVHEALLNAPDFLEEIVRSEAAGEPGGGDSSPATKEARRRPGWAGWSPKGCLS